MLSARNLTIGTRLLDVNTRIDAGKITAICGPNGAGKSTLLSALAGLQMPEHGEVLLGEELLGVIAPRARARQIGYLPQDGEVAWDLTVRSLAALGRLPHGDKAAEIIEQAISALDLNDLADRHVSTLSGGERARALLARVLAGQPEWILADEPLAALDLAHQLALLRQFRAQAERGVGVVIVLHDLALAMNFADQAIVLDQGKLAIQAAPENALSADRIAQVWNVEGNWLGESGAMGLIAR